MHLKTMCVPYAKILSDDYGFIYFTFYLLIYTFYNKNNTYYIY